VLDKNKVWQEIKCQGSQIQSPSEICSGVDLDALSSRSPQKSDLVWLPMLLPFPINDWSHSGSIVMCIGVFIVAEWCWLGL